MRRKKSMDRLDERNRQLAHSGQPVFSLEGILALKPEADLQRLREISGREDLAAWLAQADTLSMLLMALPATDFALFSKAAEAPFFREEQVLLPMHTGLMNFALMQAFLVEEQLYLVVPTQIRETWRELKRLDFPRKKNLRDTLDAYSCACSKLYGALTLEEFFEILRLRSGLKRDSEAESMLAALADGSYARLEGDMLLYPPLLLEEARDYLEDRKGLPRYLPPHEKLLRMGEGDYYDVFHQLEIWRLEVEDSLRSAGAEDSERQAMDFADTLHALLRAERGQESHEELFAHYGVPLDEERVAEVKQHVRLWSLYGNTPEEMIGKMADGSLRPAVNGPCPCGSGKKYKRCHGKA